MAAPSYLPWLFENDLSACQGRRYHPVSNADSKFSIIINQSCLISWHKIFDNSGSNCVKTFLQEIAHSKSIGFGSGAWEYLSITPKIPVHMFFVEVLKDDGLGETYSTHGRDYTCVQNISWKIIRAGILKRKWEDDIKVDLKEVRCEDMDWMYLAQVRSSGGILWLRNESLVLDKGDCFLPEAVAVWFTGNNLLCGIGSKIEMCAWTEPSCWRIWSGLRTREL